MARLCPRCGNQLGILGDMHDCILRPDAALPKEVEDFRFPDVRKLVPASLEPAITTPHHHEGKNNPPLWLIWVMRSSSAGLRDFPALDSVANSEDMCRYHVGAVLETDTEVEVYVERIPANHRFGSSLEEWQMKSYHSLRTWRKRNQLDGD